MVTTEQENPQIGSDQADIVAATRHFIASLPATGRSRPQAEGQSVALTLEQLGLPRTLIAAAELYPLVRDGLVALDELASTPAADLKQTLDGLLHLGRFSLPPDWQPGEALAISQSEALRRMLLAVVSDVRLVLIRIAEQLYRLRVAKESSPAEQRALAIEAREIYAPLANRLGVWQFKWELEDLAFRYLEPDTYTRIVRALNEKRTEREAAIENVRRSSQRNLPANDINAEVTARPKHIYSIWRKMQRKGSGLEQIFDMRAVRVLVDTSRTAMQRLASCTTCGPISARVRRLHRQAQGEQLPVAAHRRDRAGKPGGGSADPHARDASAGGARRRCALALQGRRRAKGGVRPEDRIPAANARAGGARRRPAGTIQGDIFEDRVYALSPRAT